MQKKIRIATRKSKLALWQAEHVKAQLLQFFPQLDVEIHGVMTAGDKYQAGPLSQIGDKSLFVKELELALLNNEADIAVHSMKDIPMEIPAEFTIAAIGPREDARDVLLSNHYADLASLPEQATVGTSSLRRICQLKALRPDINLKTLRGNVDSRLKQLDEDKFDAIILAAAGLIRLGVAERITEYLPTNKILPAVGQGALGIECHRDNKEVLPYLVQLNNSDSDVCIGVERLIATQLNAGCHVPLAAYAKLKGETLSIHAMVGNPKTAQIISAAAHGPKNNTEVLAGQITKKLLAQGADKILQSYANHGNGFSS